MQLTWNNKTQLTWNNKTQQIEKRKIYQSHHSSRSFVKNGITKRNWHEITERNSQLNVNKESLKY